MTEERLRYLIGKKLNRHLDPEEAAELEEFSTMHPELAALGGIFENEELLQTALSCYHEGELQKEAYLSRALAEIGESDVPPVIVPAPVRRLRAWKVAAAVILLAGLGLNILWYSSMRNAAPTAEVSRAASAVSTTKDKATLTLPDGATIALDQVPEGTILQIGQPGIFKSGKRELVYQPTIGASQTVRFHTLSTPRAGTFQVLLPDGTRVWLNNATSLRYPTFFGSKTREVTLEGEGYFEVAKDAEKPFFVSVKGDHGEALRIEVLGTSFNVKAYGDEHEISTSLLDGSVKVLNGEHATVLKPGNQLLSSENTWSVSKEAHIADAISWKNGFFLFNNADLGRVMRQLSRWYDVTVEYRGHLPEERFQGGISRDLPLEQVLENIATKQIHFRLDNRKIIVFTNQK